MSERFLRNPYEDFEEYIQKNRSFSLDKFAPEIECTVYKLLKVLELEVPIKTDSRDYSVYTGSTGIALLYMKLAEAQPEKRDQLLEKARGILITQRLAKKRHDFTFLCGDVGPIATRAVLHHRMGYSKEVKADIDLLHKFASGCLSLETGEPDELLYGRVGYLYSLLFVETHIAAHSIDSKLITSVVQAVIESGELLASRLDLPTPLMYKWHDSYYLGAAHGVAGIMYMLLEARQFLSANEMAKVKATIDYLITLRYPSGNYPSSLGSTSDRLVHWCHGAPGFMYLLAKAYEVFGEERYLKEATSTCDLIWKRGLLKKGYGLCHGVAGNGYAFLRMYRLTSNQKYLYQACRFAEFCCAYGTHGCRIADRPYSLFEGMAGTIFFLVDMLSPTQARFPAFEL